MNASLNNIDFGILNEERQKEQEAREFNSNKGIFGEYNLENIKQQFVEVPEGEYPAVPKMFVIKLINGAPIAELKYQIMDGEFATKIVSSTQWFYKYGTTEVDEKAAKNIIMFIANAYGVNFKEATEKLRQFQVAFEDIDADLRVDESLGFPQDLPVGTLKINEYKWEGQDGIERTKKYYNFYKG